ncbi:MAG TPA: DUF4276 family protein [Pseudonocardiaceae bacterium]|nr:DUF4276 family protein [Pseudonocardiaceae bacterium]
MAEPRLHVLLEGQTEEVMLRNVLEPHLRTAGWTVSWSILVTKRLVDGPAHRGGVTSWAKLERDIRRLLSGRSFAAVTTIIDYYGLPGDVPGMSSRPSGDARIRVGHVEAAMGAAIDDLRFVPHLTLHEAESWVFAAAEQLADLYRDPDLLARMRADVAAAGGPELVNDGPETAPSKRLRSYREDDYLKATDGPLAVAELGLGRLRQQCPHLHAWLTGLEARATALA